MAYSSFLYDNFDDNAIDVTKWAVWNGASFVTESGGTFNISSGTSGGDVSGVIGAPIGDCTKGIVAVKMTNTGTPTGSFVNRIGIVDPEDNYISLSGIDNVANLSFDIGSEIIYVGETIYDTTVGFGPSWASGTWLGVRYDTTNNVVYFMKSTTPITSWTLIAEIEIDPLTPMDFTNVGLLFETYTDPVPATPFVVKYEDATYWADTSYLKTRVMVDAEMVYGKPKARIGGVWVDARPKVRVGGAWLPVD